MKHPLLYMTRFVDPPRGQPHSFRRAADEFEALAAKSPSGEEVIASLKNMAGDR